MNIDFANLKETYKEHKEEFDKALMNVMDNCNFILGKELNEFEERMKKYLNVKFAFGTSSGTDALLVALLALGIKNGDEIITSPFTFIATSETIALLGAKPVFVDIDEKTYNIDINKIEEKINSKTKAILPISLYGQISDIDEINKIAKKHKIKVIEDGAQSFGASYKGIKSCSLTDIAITSFFPAKPLGCFGDGGAIFTNDENLAIKIKALINHGQTKRYEHKYLGLCARLDTIQASILNIKLKYYEEDIKKRQKVAKLYDELLKDKNIILPFIKEENQSVYAQYSIRVKNRDKVLKVLKEKNIPFAIHYPKPLHLQECFSYLNYKKNDFPISEKISEEILSLPMNPHLKKEEQEYIKEVLDIC